jgi:hypothetical protein
VRRKLTEFVLGVFNHIPTKRIGVGEFLGIAEAEVAIQQASLPRTTTD